MKNDLKGGAEGTTMEFKDSKEAFDYAIQAGRLSVVETDDNYVGRYMYMGTCAGKDLFKHIMTREYLD